MLILGLFNESSSSTASSSRYAYACRVFLHPLYLPILGCQGSAEWRKPFRYLVNHQDKAVDYKSTGVETHSPIFNISMGAPRTFVVADLDSLGTANREEMNVIEDHTMEHGDLYVLWPEMNENYSHGVPKDPSAKELRVSLVCAMSPSTGSAAWPPTRRLGRSALATPKARKESGGMCAAQQASPPARNASHTGRKSAEKGSAGRRRSATAPRR